MTVDELKEQLNEFDGATVVSAELGQDKNNLSIVCSIIGVTEASNALGYRKEAWLEVER